MDVFIKEPLIDWLKNARDQTPKDRGSSAVSSGVSSQQDSQASEGMAWYPMRKVDMARRKLNLAHPSLVTCEELQSGSLRKKASLINKLHAIVKGTKPDNPR